jgi:2,5-furandicarboxylate decarboxylase 1
MAVAGGIRGAAVELAQCETMDLPCLADGNRARGEILPTGWTLPRGRFGEFTRLMGGLHWNPVVRVNAVTMRRDAIYYALHMPWENTWLAAPTRYAAIRRALRTAGVQVKDINVTLGACAFWHAVISIRKQPGEGKNALLAALSVMDLKHVVVVDEDIDVFNSTDVEWAIATRVQGDRDVIVIPGAREAARPQPGGDAAGGVADRQVGIDATIGEGIPHERFERIAMPMPTAQAGDYLKGKSDAPRTAGRRSSSRISAEISSSSRGAEVPGNRRALRRDDFRPSPARRAGSTRSRSCGGTRGDACACADPPLPQNHRKPVTNEG